MDLYNRDDLREFLVSLYGEQAKRWEMTEKMFNLTHTLVRESGSCTSAMNFVPRPMPIGQTPYKYLSKQLRSAFLRHLNYNKEHYISCLKVAAWRMASEFRMASAGL